MVHLPLSQGTLVYRGTLVEEQAGHLLLLLLFELNHPQLRPFKNGRLFNRTTKSTRVQWSNSIISTQSNDPTAVT